MPNYIFRCYSDYNVTRIDCANLNINHLLQGIYSVHWGNFLPFYNKYNRSDFLYNQLKIEIFYIFPCNAYKVMPSHNVISKFDDKFLEQLSNYYYNFKNDIITAEFNSDATILSALIDDFKINHKKYYEESIIKNIVE